MLMRSSRSPIFNEIGDLVTVVFDRGGRTLAQTEYASIIANGAGPPLPYILERFEGDLHDGDVILHNDVYTGGNQNADVGVYMPVFHGGELVAWTASKGHVADIGGMTAGGYDPNAREVWQEAFRIPPLKLVDRGAMRPDVWELVRANIRLDIVTEDIKSMIGACTIGKRRLLEVLDRYGVETLRAAHGLRDRRLRAARRAPRSSAGPTASTTARAGWSPTGSTRRGATGSPSRSRSPAPRSPSTSPTPTTRRPASRTCRPRRRLGRGPDRVPDADERRRDRRADERGPVRAGARPSSARARCSTRASRPRRSSATRCATRCSSRSCSRSPTRCPTASPPAGTSSSARRSPASTRARGEPSVSLSIFMRGGPGAMRGADGFDALGFTGHARLDALARHGDVRALDAALHGVLRVPARLGRRGRVARRPRHALELALLRRSTSSASTIGDDAATEGADPAPGPLRRRAGRPQRAPAALPGRHACGTGARRRSSTASPRARSARRCNGGGGGYGDPRRRDAQKVLAEVRDGLLSRREGARELRRRGARRRRGHRRGRDGAAARSARMSYRVGIDVGGTFTDFLVLGGDGDAARPQDELDARRPVARPRRPASRRSPRRSAPTLADVPGRRRADRARHDRHDERRAHPPRRAHRACSATEGFRDALALRNGTARGAVRQPPAAARAARPALPAPRRRRSASTTRATRSRRSTSDDVRAACRASCAPRASRRSRSRSCTRRPSPAHERRARELCRELLPGAYVTASSDLLPQVRYYDRTSTTVLNAYVGPIITRYLAALTAPPRRARLRRRAADHAVERRRRDARRGRPSAPRSRCSRARRPGPTAGLWQLAPHGDRGLHHDRHGRHELRRRAREGRRAARDDRRRSSTAGGSRCRRSTSTRSAPAAARSRGVDDGGLLQRRPAERRAPSPARPATAAAARSRRRPTPTSCSATSAEASFLGGGMRLDRAAAARAIDEHVAAAARHSASSEAAAGRLRRRQRRRWRPACAR